MSQNNTHIVDTFDLEQWVTQQTAPLPTLHSNDSLFQPTVRDELRWSLQTAVRPLEAGAQMAAGVHGITTKDPAEIADKIDVVKEQLTNAVSTASKTKVKEADLSPQTVFAAINRINEVTLEQMGAPVLRMYLSEMAAMHPAILQYMRDNNSTFTYFKPVSESVGLMLSIVADVACTDLAEWAEIDVIREVKNYSATAIRWQTFFKLFPEIGDLVEVAHATCNGYMMRAIPQNSALKFADSLTAAHGLNNTADKQAWKGIAEAKPAILDFFVDELGDQLRLIDHFWPVSYNIAIENTIYSMPVNGLITFVDQLGEKVFNKERSTDVLIPYDAQVVKETLR